MQKNISQETPKYWQEAKLYLSEQDKVLAQVIGNYAGEILVSRGSAFFSLARAIVGQQISVKAADSVWKKLEGNIGEVIPDNVLYANPEILRGSGLSGQKVIYLTEIAKFFAENKPSWHDKSDEEVIKELTAIKGIGKWSAQMFLMFHLLRANVFPIADIGLQKAIERNYNAGEKMLLKDMQKLAENWQPYRTVASWYLWRSLDHVPVEY